MSKHITRELVAEQAAIHASPVKDPEADRSFNLPTPLYAITAGLYFAFLGIMAAGFGNPGLVVPMAIFVVFLGAFFGLAAIFAKVDPEASSKILRWSEFKRKGIATHTGPLAMRDAIMQMLILPVLIVFWGLAVVTIASLV